MADENQVNDDFQDESKRDTVRINLPQGGGGKSPLTPTPTVRLKPVGAANVAPSTIDTRKATAAIAPAAAPTQTKKDTTAVAIAPVTPVAAQPKKETSHVQIPAAKPTVPEMPRPTVKLKREEPPVPAAPTVVTEADASSEPVEVGSAIGGLDLGLALAAMVVALVVAGYVFSLSLG